MRTPARLVAMCVAAGLLGVVSARHAWAFCRTTTCDLALGPGVQGPPECEQNIKIDECSTQGKPLHWPQGCLWFGTEMSGSAKLGISSEALHAAVKKAFATWAGVDCGGGKHPSFAVLDTDDLFGAASCGTPEFNKDAANANVWMFSDSAWPNQDPVNALAITLSTADLSTGALYDADVTLNSFSADIAVTARGAEASLFTVVLHEAGHYLGLAHSSSKNAVMSALYSPQGSTLDADDKEGICAIYPPTQSEMCGEPEPRFGFSRYCGGESPSTEPVDTSTPTTPEESNTVKSAGCNLSPVVASPSLLTLVGPAFAFSIWTRRRKSRAKSSAS